MCSWCNKRSGDHPPANLRDADGRQIGTVRPVSAPRGGLPINQRTAAAGRPSKVGLDPPIDQPHAEGQVPPRKPAFFEPRIDRRRRV